MLVEDLEYYAMGDKTRTSVFKLGNDGEVRVEEGSLRGQCNAFPLRVNDEDLAFDAGSGLEPTRRLLELDVCKMVGPNDSIDLSGQVDEESSI